MNQDYEFVEVKKLDHIYELPALLQCIEGKLKITRNALTLVLDEEIDPSTILGMRLVIDDAISELFQLRQHVVES